MLGSSDFFLSFAVINRDGLARAVLQTALSLNKGVSHDFIKIFLKNWHT